MKVWETTFAGLRKTEDESFVREESERILDRVKLIETSEEERKLC